MGERIRSTGHGSASSCERRQSLRERRKRHIHLAILAVMVVLGILFVLPFPSSGWSSSPLRGRPTLFPSAAQSTISGLFNLKIVTENGQLLTSYINSFFVAVCSVALNHSACSGGRVRPVKGRFPGKGVILMVILSTMMIPFETRMIPSVHHVQCRGPSTPSGPSSCPPW